MIATPLVRTRSPGAGRRSCQWFPTWLPATVSGHARGRLRSPGGHTLSAPDTAEAEPHEIAAYGIVHATAAFQADSVKLAVGQRKQTAGVFTRSEPAAHSWYQRGRPVAHQGPGGTSPAQPRRVPGAAAMRSPEGAAAAVRPPFQPPAAPIPPASVRGSDYAELSRLVRQAGLLERRRWPYVWRITVTATLLAAGWTVFIVVGDSWWQLA